MKCQSCLRRIDEPGLCDPCLSAAAKQLTILRGMPEQGERGTGRTTAIALEAVAHCIRAPRSIIRTFDHHPGQSGQRALADAILRIVSALGLQIIVAGLVAGDQVVLHNTRGGKASDLDGVRKLNARFFAIQERCGPSKELIKALKHERKKQLKKKGKKKCERSVKK